MNGEKSSAVVKGEPARGDSETDEMRSAAQGGSLESAWRSKHAVDGDAAVAADELSARNAVTEIGDGDGDAVE